MDSLERLLVRILELLIGEVLYTLLQDAWRSAARIGAESQEEHLHRLCCWASGVDEPAIWRHVRVPTNMMEAEPRPATTKGDTTVSASTVLANAEEFQRATGSKELGRPPCLVSGLTVRCNGTPWRP
jgi:hypothetical protein